MKIRGAYYTMIEEVEEFPPGAIIHDDHAAFLRAVINEPAFTHYADIPNSVAKDMDLALGIKKLKALV